jgi:hypothetical protein
VKRKKFKELREVKCSQIVRYHHYVGPGVRSERHGRCSRWTLLSCGKCRQHCEAYCPSHRITREVSKRRRA